MCDADARTDRADASNSSWPSNTLYATPRRIGAKLLYSLWRVALAASAFSRSSARARLPVRNGEGGEAGTHAAPCTLRAAFVRRRKQLHQCWVQLPFSVALIVSVLVAIGLHRIDCSIRLAAMAHMQQNLHDAERTHTRAHACSPPDSAGIEGARDGGGRAALARFLSNSSEGLSEAARCPGGAVPRAKRARRALLATFFADAPSRDEPAALLHAALHPPGAVRVL